MVRLASPPRNHTTSSTRLARSTSPIIPRRVSLDWPVGPAPRRGHNTRQTKGTATSAMLAYGVREPVILGRTCSAAAIEQPSKVASGGSLQHTHGWGLGEVRRPL